METKKYIEISKKLSVILVFIIPIYLIIQLAFNNEIDNVSSKTATYVGKEGCKDCHIGEYNDWLGSHHDKAMDFANDSTVLGNFSNVTFISGGREHKMYKRDDRFFVFTDGEDGRMQEFEVKYVFGFTPLQQYLVEFDRGRLQTLALTWNTLDNSWYHMADSLYKDEVVDKDNWLHWTNQAQNWNGMCAECHSTNLVKGYDVKTDSYNTTWSEIDVSCEACHGPGSNHVEWANLPEYSQNEYTNYGLVVKTSGIDHVQYVDNCVRCHSRKTSLGDFDHAAVSIYDHCIPDLPDEPSWFIDGQILDEDYVYASFLQSKMYEREIQCNDCHNVHSTKLLFEGNNTCLQCHQAETYDNYYHHFHKEKGMQGDALISESGVKFDVGSGTECINCHMHGRYYMGVDYRHDHSFRIPRPDLSIQHGTPNACIQCHANETNEWALSYVNKWFGESKRYHYAEALFDAKKSKPSAATQLKNIIDNDLYPPNIRSLSIEHLGTFFPDSIGFYTKNYLNHSNPSFRLSAMRTITMQTDENIQKLLTALSDPTKAVRIEAVQRLLQASSDRIPPKHKTHFETCLAEYKQVLEYNADFPIGKLNMGNYYFSLQDYTNAEFFYKKALEQDKELYFINENLARLYNRTGNNQESEKYFKAYLSHEPNNAEVRFSYALLLAEMKKYPESLAEMLKSIDANPQMPRVNHNIAMMYDFMGDKTKAEQYLKQEIVVAENLNSYSGLLKFYVDNNRFDNALALAQRVLDKYPEAVEVKQLLTQLKSRR